MAAVLAQEVEEPLVVLRFHVEQLHERLVVPARLLESHPYQVPHVFARQIARHERLVRDIPERLALEQDAIEQRLSRRGCRSLRAGGLGRRGDGLHLGWQVFAADHPARAAAREPLGDITQLAHVARPVVGLERRDRVVGRGRQRHAVLHRELPQEVFEQWRDVVTPLAQRRNRDVDHVQAVVEIFAKVSARDALRQPAVGGGHHTHVGVDAVALVADALDLAGFEEAEQQRLHAQRHLADFVEEHRAAVGGFEETALVAVGVGEAAAGVAEQLGFEQRVGHGRAVDREHRRVAAPAARVDQVGHDLFAHAAGAGDEHLGVGPGRVLDLLMHHLERLAPADQRMRARLRRGELTGTVEWLHCRGCSRRGG